MSRISSQLSGVLRRIDEASRASGSATLVAVSKTFPAADIREAVAAGQLVFGESRLQEAEPKIRELPDNLEWHFIGRVQRNKVRKILSLFQYVHAVDSLRLAEYMDAVAADLGIRAKVFLQVDQACEESKGGFDITSLRRELPSIMELKHLDVVGLMTIPPAAGEVEETRHWFRGLRNLRDELAEGSSTRLPYLSMGMSGDFEVAIQEGATHVRVGSAIFGKRDQRVDGELG